MRGLVDRFKAVNHRLNERWFAPAPYLHYYLGAVRRALDSTRVVVHFGAGSGRVCRDWHLFEDCRYIAVDLDHARLLRNPGHLRIVADGRALPFRTSSVDLIATEHTFEHLEHPTAVLADLYRVLRDGGAVIFAVPNRGSYVGLGARTLPLRVRGWFYQMHHGAAEDGGHDLTPAFYRLNTVETISRAARQVGFRITDCRSFVGGPSYTLAFPPPVHLLAILWHKLLDRAGALASLRINLVGVLVKGDG